MLGLESCSVVSVGGYLHSKGPAEHGCDGAYHERDSADEAFHTIDADVDDGSHDHYEECHNFVFSCDEGWGSLFDDGANGDGVKGVDKLSVLIVSALRCFALDFAEFPVVVEGPDEPKYAWDEDKGHNKH